MTAAIIINLCLLYLFTGVLSGACPNGWYGYRESCYLMSRTGVDWADALTFCKALKSGLVQIETKEEDDFIRKTLTNITLTVPPHGYWIGLTDVQIKHEWTWIGSGMVSSSLYSNWNPGQPDSRDNENCGILWYSTGFTWHDDFCTDINAFFICEKELSIGYETFILCSFPSICNSLSGQLVQQVVVLYTDCE